MQFVACFEGAKGVLVLLAGFGLLSLVHHDVQLLAEHFVDHFHLNPASRYTHIFIRLSENISDRRLWLSAIFSFAYATLRLIEAYGLWFAKRWAEWLAVASGGIYLPVELYELLLGVSWIKVVALLANASIVLYLACVIRYEHNVTPILSDDR
jgi:uncharacterized membrane protein (DUF2068 family)